MAQFIFKRGLSDNFVLKLNQEWKDKNSIWYQATVDKDVFIAIRDEYINIYYKGNSLFKIENNVNGIKYSTHFKYLLDMELKTNYVDLKNIAELNINSKTPSLANIKKASKPYSGIEKDGVHKIIHSKDNDNVIDLEIAFTGNEESKNSRIDFACLHIGDKSDELTLKLYEAKHISNPEIRKNEETCEDINTKAVIVQISRYTDILNHHSDEIITSYKNIIRNFKSLKGNCFEKWQRVKTEEIKLNLEPLLVIFGFDDDQKKGDNFKLAIDKIKENLSEGRVLLKGNPKDFSNGIKSKTSIFEELK